MAEQTKNEVLIHGRLYDITNFKHPGGSVMRFHGGHGDATEAYDQFHLRSKKADKMLKMLPSRDPPPKKRTKEDERREKLSVDFAKFWKQLQAEGYYDCSITHTVLRLLDLLVTFSIGLYLLLKTPYWVLGLAVLGITQGRCGWLMHEGGHYSMTGNIPFDIFMQEFLFGVGCGMSGAWWRVAHNKHHTMPQTWERDVDLNTLPLVAFNKMIAKTAKNNMFCKLWIPNQVYTFAGLSTCATALIWQFILHPRHIIRTKQVREAFWLAVRYSIIGYMAYWYNLTIGQFVFMYVLMDLFGGTYIFCNFAVSHTSLPVATTDKVVHWLEYGSDYTLNIYGFFFTNWWMGYLNYQIEHHLFPCMPQYRFPTIWPRVQKFFEEHDLKYDVRSYWGAMADTFRNLKEVGDSMNMM